MSPNEIGIFKLGFFFTKIKKADFIPINELTVDIIDVRTYLPILLTDTKILIIRRSNHIEYIFNIVDEKRTTELVQYVKEGKMSTD